MMTEQMVFLKSKQKGRAQGQRAGTKTSAFLAGTYLRLRAHKRALFASRARLGKQAQFWLVKSYVVRPTFSDDSQARTAACVAYLDVDQLAHLSTLETEKFRRRLPYTSVYSFELFRRALVLRNQYAWSKLYEQYYPFVRGWVLSHKAAGLIGDELEDVINGAFIRLNRAITPERFQNGFRELPALMVYLRQCTFSTILDLLRRRSHEPVLAISDTLPEVPWMAPASLSRLQAEELWHWLESQLHDEQERTLVYATYVQDLKPGAIAEAYPSLFKDVNQVYSVKRNVLTRLQRSAKTADLF